MNPHIKYRQLRAFALVASTGSFKAAAEAMAITQSSLSALIKELEQDLGSALIARTTRSCKLTEAGAAFLEEVQGPLDRLDEAYRHAQKAGAANMGKLDLAALSSLCSGVLVRELADFQRRHPGVRIKLMESSHVGVIDAVRRGEAELGIGSMPKPDSDLVFEPLFADRLMLIAPKRHPSSAMPADWRTLAGFPQVFLMTGFTERALALHGLRTRPAFEVQQASTALAMVRNGMGVTVLPSSVTPNLNTSGLLCRPIQGDLAIRPLGTIRRASVKQTQPARLFSELLEAASALPRLRDLSSPAGNPPKRVRSGR